MKGKLSRVSLLIVAIFGLVATMTAPARATTPTEIPLDLAAIPLTPTEVEAIGFEGYGTDYGWLTTQGEAVREVSAYYGVPTDEFAATMVDEAGLKRYYTVRTARPVEREDPWTVATALVFSDVYEFASAEGAAAGEDYLYDIALPPGAEPDENARAFGDSSRIVRYSKADNDTGDRVEALALIVRSGTLVVELDVEDIVRVGEDANTATVDQVNALGDRLMERIEDVRTGELPNLGSRVIRLGTEGNVFLSADRYEVMNGQLIRHFNRSSWEESELQRLVDEGGVIDRYIVFQDVIGNPYDWTKAPGTMIKLDHLAGEAEAEAWFASAYDRLKRWTSLKSLESLDADEQPVLLGDQAVAFEFTIDFGGGPLSGHLLVVRKGQDVFEVRAYSPNGVSLATATTLAKAQLDCVRGTRCVERLPVPEDLQAH